MLMICMWGGGPWIVQSYLFKVSRELFNKINQELLKRNKGGKHTGVQFIVITREAPECN